MTTLPLNTQNVSPSITTSEESKMVTTLTTNQKWSITKESLSVTSKPSKQHDYRTEDCSFTDVFYIQHAQELKDAKEALRRVGDENPLEELVLVDTIQRLGIEYLFQDEIATVLKRQFMMINDNDVGKNQDLYEVSLRFRLLRQEGYNVPADVFDSFKDKEGNLNIKLGEDVIGLMALYEAAQLNTEGEDILEDATTFSSQLLNSLMAFLHPHEKALVRNTLKHPYHKSLARFRAKKFITSCNGKNIYVNALQELANSDFRMVQTIHQNELIQISRWWDDLGLMKELKNIRNKPLKWHMWSIASLADPSWSEVRIELTKPISLIYVIDDIFDVNGTLDELTLFTEAVNRWDLSEIGQLPDYMKMCFKVLDAVTNEIGSKVYKEHGLDPTDSLRKAWATLFDAFLVEAKWFNSGYFPSAEEYLKNGVVSSGVHVVLVHLLFLFGDGLSQESSDNLNPHSGIMSSVARILRLWDDLGSAKDENQDGHDGSYVTCYMKEHEGSSVETAQQEVRNMISETWKQLNKQCLSPCLFSGTYTKACLNLARMVPLMYSYDDDQNLPVLEEHVKSMLFDDQTLKQAIGGC